MNPHRPEEEEEAKDMDLDEDLELEGEGKEGEEEMEKEEEKGEDCNDPTGESDEKKEEETPGSEEGEEEGTDVRYILFKRGWEKTKKQLRNFANISPLKINELFLCSQFKYHDS